MRKWGRGRPRGSEAGQWFPIGGTDLYCRIAGTGPPILLLHGYGQSSAVFVDLENYLVRDRQVVLLDSRGHGQSGAGSHPLSTSLMAADAVALLRRLDINMADVIGYSDGGNVALQMAVDYPQYVKSITVISGNARPDGLVRYFRFFVVIWRAMLYVLSAAYILPRAWYQMTDLLLHQPQIDNDALRQITAPALFIRASRDVVAHTHTAELGRLVPNSMVVTVNHSNHASIIRHWRKYIRHIENILDQGGLG